MKDQIFYRILQLLLSNPYLQNIRILFYFYDEFILRWILKPSSANERKKQILVVFSAALGDCVMFLRSLPYLQTLYPPEHFAVTVICQKEYKELLENYFDYVLAVDYRKASVNPFYRIKLYKILREKYYDTALDPIGSEECSPNVFTMNAVCAGEKIGIISSSNKKRQCPDWMQKKIYTKILYNPVCNLHKVKFYTFFWEKLGAAKCEVPMRLFAYQFTKKLPERYFMVFPSASTKVKMWPVDRFVEITKRIYREIKIPLVLCGTKSDSPIVNEFIELLHGEVPYFNFLEQTSVKELIGIIGNAELVLTNDTSAYHIAVMQKRKVCVVTGGYVYDLFINYPCNSYDGSQPLIVCKKPSCMNCSNQCVYKVKGAYPCVENNTVEEVWEAVQTLIGSKKL